MCADPLQISKVAEVIVHPDYNPPHEKANYNDIAVIRMKKAARVSGSNLQLKNIEEFV